VCRHHDTILGRMVQSSSVSRTTRAVDAGEWNPVVEGEGEGEGEGFTAEDTAMMMSENEVRLRDSCCHPSFPFNLILNQITFLSAHRLF
jgi:hypothetical protein